MVSTNNSFFKEGSLLFKKNFWKISTYNLFLVIISLALFLLFALVIGLCFSGIVGENDYLSTAGVIFFVLFFIFFLLISPVLGAGYQYIYVKLIRGEEVSFKNIFAGFKHFWSIWLTYYFTQIISLAGLILFLIPIFILCFFAIGIHLNIPESIINSYYFNNYLPTSILVLLILMAVTFIVASFYWGAKLFLTHLSAIDRRLHPGDAIYYGNMITKGNKFKIFLNFYLPLLIIFVLVFFLGYITGDNFTANNIVNIVVNIVNTFFFIPWFSSILAVTYVRLSENFDNNLPGDFMDRFTVKKITKDKPVSTIENNLKDEVGNNATDKEEKEE